jgi:ABC-2 type transport system ATP-binding protein
VSDASSSASVPDSSLHELGSPPPLLGAKSARILVDGALAVESFDLVTTGARLVLAGDPAPLFGLLSRVPLGLAASVEGAQRRVDLPPKGEATLASGSLALLGADVRRAPRDVGVALFDPPLPAADSVAAWCTNAARLAWARKGISVRRAECTEAVSRTLVRLGLGAAASRPLRSLALPERRVLALAAATVGDPRVLLADRPLSGLSGEAAGFVLAALEAIASERALVSTVSRLDPASAEAALARNASDLAIFLRGELALAGPPHAVLDGARRVRVVVRSSHEALGRELEALGASASGGPYQLLVALPDGLGPTAVLVAAARARAPVVEIVPLM